MRENAINYANKLVKERVKYENKLMILLRSDIITPKQKMRQDLGLEIHKCKERLNLLKVHLLYKPPVNLFEDAFVLTRYMMEWNHTVNLLKEFNNLESSSMENQNLSSRTFCSKLTAGVLMKMRILDEYPVESEYIPLWFSDKFHPPMNLQAEFEPLELIRSPDVEKLAQSKVKNETKTPTREQIINLKKILLQMPRLYNVEEATLDNIIKQSFLYILNFLLE